MNKYHYIVYRVANGSVAVAPVSKSKFSKLSLPYRSNALFAGGDEIFYKYQPDISGADAAQGVTAFHFGNTPIEG